MEFKELIFVSGKGGVGKSTLSTMIARELASQGQKVLLVEMAARSAVGALLGSQKTPGYRPTPSGFGFDWALISGTECLAEYVGAMTKLEALTQKLFESSLLKTLTGVAPGLSDLAMLGKLTSRLRQHGPGYDYDHVVVDSPSTGSFYSFLKAPEVLGKTMSRGPLHTQCMGIDQVLKNPQHCQYFFVSLCEEIPVDELEDTLSQFSEDLPAEAIQVVLNKVLGSKELQAIEDCQNPFIKNKLEQEQKQIKRVAELWTLTSLFELMTEPFPVFAEQYSGGGIRQL